MKKHYRILPSTMINDYEFLDKLFSQIKMKDNRSCWESDNRYPGNRYYYSTIRYAGENYGIHRVVFSLWYGIEVPAKYDICHKCDNTQCCNPHHLFMATHSDNLKDRYKKEAEFKYLYNDLFEYEKTAFENFIKTNNMDMLSSFEFYKYGMVHSYLTYSKTEQEVHATFTTFMAYIKENEHLTKLAVDTATRLNCTHLIADDLNILY